MDREHRQNVQPSLAVIDSIPADAADRRRIIAIGASSARRGAAAALAASQQRTRTSSSGSARRGAHRPALSWLIGRSITRPLNGLARRHEAARRRRHLRAHSGHRRQGRDRRDGAHRDRVPRHMRSSASGWPPSEARSQSRARAAQRGDRGDHRALRAVGRPGAGQGARRRATGWRRPPPLNGAADAVSAEARTAEERVGAASENVTAAASSVEELAASIGEIAGAGAKIDRGRRPRGLGGAPHRAHHVRARQRRNPHRRGGRPDPGDRRPDQSAGAQRHHRGGARRRGRPRLRGRRLRGQVARRPDRQGDRGDRRPDRRDPVGGRATRRRRSSRSTPSSRTCRRIAATVAAAVEEQNAAVASIAEGVNRASARSADRRRGHEPRRRRAQRCARRPRPTSRRSPTRSRSRPKASTPRSGASSPTCARPSCHAGLAAKAGTLHILWARATLTAVALMVPLAPGSRT